MRIFGARVGGVGGGEKVRIWSVDTFVCGRLLIFKSVNSHS